MDNNIILENQINVDGGNDISLEDILAEFKAEEKLTNHISQEDKERSRPIRMDNMGQYVGEAKISSSSGIKELFPQIKTCSQESIVQNDLHSRNTNVDKEATRRIYFHPQKNKNTPAEETDFSECFENNSHSNDSFQSLKEPVWDESIDMSTSEKDYAPSNDYEQSANEYDEKHPSREIDLKEKFLSPIIGLIAAASMRREEQRKIKRAESELENKNLLPEMSVGKASHLYLDQAQSLKLRCFLATALCLVLSYLSYGLPAMGLLGSSFKIRTLVCLIFELVVVLIGLDVFTNGLIALFKKSPSSESLVSVSCIMSAVHAIYIIVSEDYSTGLPFCAVSALSMTFTLWGHYLNCKSFALNFRTAAISKSPSVIISENGGEDFGRVLVHSKRPISGFVRKSEEADIFENAYSYFAPILLIFSIILSIFCFLASDKCDNLIHTLSAGIAVSASFSAVLGFSFPFYVLTKRLARSGVAIAGYAGSADLGRIQRVVIKDKDLFPVRTLSIANISVSDGFYPDKVTSYTASMIAAAGMGIAPAFTELMKKNGYTMKKVEDFACHEGGGIVARINGDMVYVGSSSFMQLMGIRLEKGSASKSAVYTAINDILAGTFEINYVPVSSVQRGLVTLLKGKTEPVFAVRDFNITPLLVKQKFRLPKENYDFPSFADRYRISSAETEEGGSIAAVFSRGGLNAVAGLIKRGIKLYRSLIFCVVISVLGSIVGMTLMLFMCWAGAYDSASCANAMSFMLFWLVPVFIVSFGLRR